MSCVDELLLSSLALLDRIVGNESEANRRTDRQTDGVQCAMWPPRKRAT